MWGRKQVQKPKHCLKCQCFGKHQAVKCASIHDVCGQCGRQHRTSLCDENAREKWECSNCKATGNNTYKGHRVVDRRCLIFLKQVDRMNNTQQENRYRYFCTNLATWEINEHSGSGEQNMSDSQGQEQVDGQQKWELARGRLGGGKRGKGGSNMQR